jgi:hypothetical protein
LRGGHRPAEVVALGLVTAQLRQQVGRRLVLHTLRHDAQPQVVGEVDGRADDDPVALVAQHITDEGTVDLQHVNRELFEVRQRRVARPEVVDRDPHSQGRKLRRTSEERVGSAMMLLSVISTSSADSMRYLLAEASTRWGSSALGACLRILRSDRCYERVDISGLTGVNAPQRAALLALGAIEQHDPAAEATASGLLDAGQ